MAANILGISNYVPKIKIKLPIIVQLALHVVTTLVEVAMVVKIFLRVSVAY